MLGWWHRRSKLGKIVLAGAPILGVLIGLGNYSGDVGQNQRADRMAAVGTAAIAVPVQVTEKSRSHGPFDSHTYTVEYAFADAGGKPWNGSSEMSAGEFQQLFDPGHPTMLRADARLAVVYNKSDPRENGLKAHFERTKLEPSLVASIVSALVAVGVIVLLGAGAMRLFRRRPSKPA